MSDTYVCREGHYHDGPVMGKPGTYRQRCPEELVSDLIGRGMGYDAAVEKVYGEGACQYFALCENPATGYVLHPTLGRVPGCQRCADRVGATLIQEQEAP